MVEADFEFGVLGTLDVYREGRPVPLPGARQRAVLAALISRGGGPVPADVLIEAAWGDSLPANPTSALHTVVSRLRAAIDVEIVSSDSRYHLVCPADAVDAYRFQRLCTEASRHSGMPRMDLLEEALGLWRGPAYVEFADRDFAAAEAVRLNELRLNSFEDLAELRIDAGHFSRVVVDLSAHVDEHPFRERAHRLYMTALYGAGRATEALDHYQGYRRLLAQELGLEPSPALSKVEERILTHELGHSTSSTGSALTSGVSWMETDTAFLGREDDVATLLELVRGHRVVTLTGTAGVGKSRLVAELLPSLVNDPGFPVSVVELAPVTEGLVGAVIAESLGIGGATDMTEATIEYLSITPALLVLDACEHLLPEVRDFVTSVIARCPRVRLILTSRRRAGLPVEQVFPVEPLATPDDRSRDASPELNAAVRLFVDRARRVRPRFPSDSEALQVVAGICRRLDGLPLAIELAATRAAVLGLEPLRDLLVRSFAVLDHRGDDGEGRSLRGTITCSYELLDPPSRRLFAMLGVFEGEFGLEAVESVSAGIDDDELPLHLAGLVDASMVVGHSSSASPRFRLLQTVRAFALERLAADAAERKVRKAHARWVLSIVRRSAESVLKRGDADSFRLHDESANIHSAVTWSLEAGQRRLAGEITGALALAFQWRGGLEHLNLVRRVGDELASSSSPESSLARAAGGFAAAWQGDLDFAEAAAVEALGTARTSDDHFLALCTLGIVTLYQREYESSSRWWQRLLALDGLAPVREVHAHASLALIACYRGALPSAHAHAANAMAAAETGSDAYRSFAAYAHAQVAAVEDASAGVSLLGDAMADAELAGADFVAGTAGTALVSALTRLGRVEEAIEMFEPLMDRLLRLAAWPQLWAAMRSLADMLAREERVETAALVLAAADRAVVAPEAAFPDPGQLEELARSVDHRLDGETRATVSSLASRLPRTEIVARAKAAVHELRIGITHCE